MHLSPIDCQRLLLGHVGNTQGLPDEAGPAEKMRLWVASGGIEGLVEENKAENPRFRIVCLRILIRALSGCHPDDLLNSEYACSEPALFDLRL